MANRNIIDNGLGAIGRFPPIVLGTSGFTEQQAAWMSGVLDSITEALNGNLSLGNADHATRSGNIFGQWVQQYFPTKDIEMEIPHGLGKRPTDAFFGLPNAACTFYSSRRGSWSEKSIWIACSVDGVTVPILIF